MQFKKADSFGFEPRRAAIREKCPKNRRRIRGLCQELWIPAISFAQSFSIDWYKVAGGGGTSTGGVYAVSGTIGQPDAGGPMSGDGYSLTGGFWSLISVMRTAGFPDLTIMHAGNSVIVSWLNTGSYSLQQNTNLAATAGWTTSGYAISTSNGTNFVTITPPTGNLFFHLAHP